MIPRLRKTSKKFDSFLTVSSAPSWAGDVFVVWKAGPLAIEPRRRPHESPPPPGPIVSIEEATRYDIPTTEEGWAELERWEKVDFNDLAHKGKDFFWKWLDESPTYVIKWDTSEVVSAQNIMRCYPKMRDPVIHGVVRRGESMNIIAPPKAGKSWLGLNIAMNIIGGGKLFGRFQCERGRVLIVDNELHCETIAQRLRDVSLALNVPVDRAGRLIDFIPLRGRLASIMDLEQKLEHIRRRTYAVVILDAFYKFYPEDFDENSNSDMARLYTILDGYAEHLDSSIILIHHSSKGLQSGKSVTDMGAGAGSQSRACDAHIVLREHDDPGVFVIDSANRSFPPIAPFCAKFKWPRWEEAPNADPEMLKGLQKKLGSMRVGGSTEAGQEAAKISRKAEERKRIDAFVAEAITEPKSIPEIIQLGYGRSLGTWNRDKMKVLIPALLKDGVLKLVSAANGNQPAKYIATEKTTASNESPSEETRQQPHNDGYTAGFNNDNENYPDDNPECEDSGGFDNVHNQDSA